MTRRVRRLAEWAAQVAQGAATYHHVQPVPARPEQAQGQRFNAQRFHDFILAQGLLPPRLLEKAVMEDFVKPATR